MNDLFAKLFSLRRLRPDDEGVAFEFAREIPAWGWLLVVLAAAGLAVWAYARLSGWRPGRAALGVVRTILLVLLVVLLAGPRLVRQSERVDRDWVVSIVDRSASMQVKDVVGAEGAEVSTREAQLGTLLTAATPAFAELSRQKNLVWLGFDAATYDLAAPGGGEAAMSAWGEAQGRRSDLNAALAESLRRLAARPASGLVVFSDGRASAALDPGLMRSLEQQRLPVFVVPLGGAEPLADSILRRVDWPELAFLDDIVPVVATVERRGGKSQTGGAVVQLVDASTGEVLSEQRLEAAASEAEARESRVALSYRPTAAGSAEWIVRVTPDGPDLSRENNERRIGVEVVDRPVRIVYFEGYPRWEYRYLKNLLVRERSIRSSAMLIAPDRRFLQEGTDPLLTLPRTREEWNQFDAVVIGDVRPDLFSDEQLAFLKEIVSTRGAGLLWVGGASATPERWAATPLADLLPFSLAGEEGASVSLRTWLTPVTMSRAPGADRLGVLRLGDAGDEGWPLSLRDPTTGWSALRWMQRIEASMLKPTAEVLAFAESADNGPVSAAGTNGTDRTAAVVTMRYGAGRVIYVATDETWRWRYGRGETLQERFWLPLLRLLARDSLGRTGKPAILEVSPAQAQAEQPVRVSIRLLDQSLAAGAPETLNVSVQRLSDAGSAVGTASSLRLTRESAGGDGALAGGMGAALTYAATIAPAEAGRYRFEPTDAILTGVGLSGQLEVFWPDDELRSPESNHALLTDLAQRTGGRVLDVATIGELPRLLPNRADRVLGTPEIETLWDKPIVLVMLVLLVTIEWIGRRLLKLA